MTLSAEPSNRGYILYVDEAGDTGLQRVQPIDPAGSSEWLVIGGVLVRAEREMETVRWVRAIREKIRIRQRPDLHFRLLSDDRKNAVCQEIASLPVRCFVLLSNKKNLRGYKNTRAEHARTSTQEWYYNFCVRLLLERVTHYVKGRTQHDFGETRHVEVVFSDRGGMKYSQTKAYYDLLRAQARSGSTVLKKRTIQWEVLHPHLVRSIPHRQNAGVQLADAVASSFYQAASAKGDHAKQLAKVLPMENGKRRDYSVALMPTPPAAAELTAAQKDIFRYFGYKL